MISGGRSLCSSSPVLATASTVCSPSTLHQQTVLGQYLDPIADKLLMSTMFLVLSIEHRIPWKYTVVVFSRDVSILLISGVLFTIAGLRDFRPAFSAKLTPARRSARFFSLCSC